MASRPENHRNNKLKSMQFRIERNKFNGKNIIYQPNKVVHCFDLTAMH